MKTTTHRLLAFLLSIPLLASAGENIGFVLIAKGDVSALRSGRVVPLMIRSNIEVGDIINSANHANAQLRMNDKSLISLKPNTQLKITAHTVIPLKPEESKVAMELIKGGLRSISGAISQVNPKNYSITTEHGNLGIRGTHFNLVLCNNSCTNDNGTQASNGLYGSVADGGVVMRNATGEKTFDKGQYFYMSQTTVPQQLISPPTFLRDKLEARQNEREQKKAEARAENETAKKVEEKGKSSATNITNTAGNKTPSTNSTANAEKNNNTDSTSDSDPLTAASSQASAQSVSSTTVAMRITAIAITTDAAAVIPAITEALTTAQTTTAIEAVKKITDNNTDNSNIDNNNVVYSAVSERATLAVVGSYDNNGELTQANHALWDAAVAPAQQLEANYGGRVGKEARPNSSASINGADSAALDKVYEILKKLDDTDITIGRSGSPTASHVWATFKPLLTTELPSSGVYTYQQYWSSSTSSAQVEVNFGAKTATLRGLSITPSTTEKFSLIDTPSMAIVNTAAGTAIFSANNIAAAYVKNNISSPAQMAVSGAFQGTANAAEKIVMGYSAMNCANSSSICTGSTAQTTGITILKR